MRISTNKLILISLFAALTAIGAFIKIQLPYIPFTLQFFFCAMSGILLGSKFGALSQILYVLIGLCGIPIFTAGGGIGYIFQPTFGYLIGFIICSFTIGKLIEKMKNKNLFNIFLAALIGMILMFAVGVPYLYMIYKLYLNNPKTVWWAIYNGFIVFLGGDILLSYLVALVSVKIIPLININKYKK